MGNQKEGLVIVKERSPHPQSQPLNQIHLQEPKEILEERKKDFLLLGRTQKLSSSQESPQSNVSPQGRLSQTSQVSTSSLTNRRLKNLKNKPSLCRKVKKREDYGLEVILDLYGCDPKLIRSAKSIRTFADKVCKLLKMKKFGRALIPHFGHGHPKTSGYSLLQFIETSSITGHFSESRNSAYINIFSCKAFNSQKAISFTKRFFKAKDIKARKIIRK